MTGRSLALLLTLALVEGVFAATVVSAVPSEGAAGEKNLGSQVSDPTTKTLCGRCHMAYAPINLPARSWAAVMDRLDTHFGIHLKIDERARRHIRAYLISKSADGGGTRWGRRLSATIPDGTTPLRITETFRFKHEHDSPLFRTMLATKHVSSARCLRCHGETELSVLTAPPPQPGHTDGPPYGLQHVGAQNLHQ